MITAVESLWIVPVLTLNVALVPLAATVTIAGTVSAGLLSANVTTAPPAGAGCVRVTVQVLDEFDPKLFGLHCTADTNTVAARFTLVLTELPL